jgi:hypothetical protein
MIDERQHGKAPKLVTGVQSVGGVTLRTGGNGAEL